MWMYWSVQENTKREKYTSATGQLGLLRPGMDWMDPCPMIRSIMKKCGRRSTVVVTAAYNKGISVYE
jgi:hypothetical protein